MPRPRLNDGDVKFAFMRFLRSPEGRVALEALQGVVEEIGPVETCALHAHNERRKFAAELIAMAIAAEEPGSDGPDYAVEQTGRSSRNEHKGRRSRRHGPAGR